MKVLHINSTDRGGGAAIAAYRHHEAMRMAGIDSKILVQNKVGNDPNVIAHRISPVSRLLKRILGRLFFELMPYYATWSWNHYGYDFSKDKEVKEADIIILHWINSYTLSIKSIENILKSGKPVYWFMHDMWPITGGCHHSLDCVKYHTHCEACPMANHRHGTSKKHDLSWVQFEEKYKRLKPYGNLHFITPSQWLADKVKQSALFGDHTVDVVRNVLNTDVFKLRDKFEARKRLRLPLDKKLILFGADNFSSPYKGWPLLRDVLAKPIEETEAVVYGITAPGFQDEIGIKLYSMGQINDIDRLIDLYNACDVFVTPSLAENYPNVLIEAMACGLPCIGTKVGGIPEIIKPGGGTVIEENDPSILRAKIIGLLQSNEQLPREDIRKMIIDNNSYHHGLSDYLKNLSDEK